MTFNEYRGHFLTRYEAAEVSNCTPRTLVEHPDVLSVRGFIPGEELYPALQFDKNGSPTPGLGVLARHLSFQLADIEIASFCTRPLKALGGKSPIDWLRDGRPIEVAARAAFAD